MSGLNKDIYSFVVEFGDQVVFPYFDFDDFRRGGLMQFLVMGVVSPNLVSFDIMHAKNSSNTVWYSNITNGTVLPNSANAPHTADHNLYVGHASYRGNDLPKPKQFIVMVRRAIDNVLLPPVPDPRSPIPLVDLWGEGAITTITAGKPMRTGFYQAYNINQKDQKISNGPNTGKSIPNLLPIPNYNSPFPLPNGSVEILTCMGAPINPGNAPEIVRVLAKPRGLIILYDIDLSGIAAIQQADPSLVKKTSEILYPPFNEINICTPDKICVLGYNLSPNPASLPNKDEL